MDRKCDEEKGTGLDRWPQELLQKIFGELNLFDLANTSDVCKRWNQIALKTNITLKMRRTFTEEGIFVRLTELLGCEKFRNLIVEADIRHLNSDEMRTFLPLLQNCANLKVLRMADILLRSPTDARFMWETITCFRGPLKHLNLPNIPIGNSTELGIELFPRPLNMLTGLEKLSFECDDDESILPKELILANQDTLREIDVIYPNEDVMRAISHCAHLSKIFILCNERVRCDLMQFIQPSTTLELTYIHVNIVRNTEDSYKGNWPYVTKLIEMIPYNCEREKLTRFPNVRELTLDFITKNTVVLNAIEIASHFNKLKVLRMKIELDDLEAHLSVFDRVPSLSQIMLSTRSYTNDPAFGKRMEIIRNLRVRGYKASFVLTNKYDTVVHRKMENRVD